MNKVQLPDVFRLPSTGLHVYLHKGIQKPLRSSITFSAHCISMLLSGEKKVYSEGQVLRYNKNSCLLYRVGNYISTEIGGEGAPYESLLLFFDNQFIWDFEMKYPEGVEDDMLGLKGISIKTDDEIDQLKNGIYTLLEDSSVHSSAIMKLKVEELFLHLINKHGRGVLKFFKTDQKRDIKRFQDVIHLHKYSGLNLEEISFLCHMSLSSFKRYFQEVYGESPGKWFNKQRLQKSAFLLGVEKKSPGEVYHELGFRSLSVFSQAFRKEFGISPKQYQLNPF